MTKMHFSALMTLLLGAVLPLNVSACGVSHHGDPLLNCEPPQFFDESRGKDAKVPSFQSFSHHGIGQQRSGYGQSVGQ